MGTTGHHGGIGLGPELVSEMTHRYTESACTYCVTQPGRQARHGRWPGWVPQELIQGLEQHDIGAPYLHQEQLAQALFHGTDCVISTGTSSGKSLGYQLAILSTLHAEKDARALYLTPTKALGADQVGALSRLAAFLPPVPPLGIAAYDGDTPPHARRALRESARVIFTNPDMLHFGILSNRQQWAHFLRNLRYVVVDEAHAYRGVFGAHVALVLRRLRRLCQRYGASPTFAVATATSFDPAGHAQMLLGTPVAVVTEDHSPRGRRTLALWQPGMVETAAGPPARRAASTEAAGLMSVAVKNGARTLTFVRSRRQAETVALAAQEELALQGRADLGTRISSYRAGYLAEDRREIERRLDSGELLGVAATSALELGIDVGGLDVVITAGYPGTRASFWQQAGRAGRRGQQSLAILVARDEPLDNYLLQHPEALIDAPVEQIVFDPTNPYVLSAHMYCAAVESPLTLADVDRFGGAAAQRVIDLLTDAGMLKARRTGWYAIYPAAERLRAQPELLSPDEAHARVDLRGGGGSVVSIVDHSDGRVLGTVDSARAPAQVHPGAVYLYRGESFVVSALDIQQGLALVNKEQPEWTTYARSETTITITADPDADKLFSPAEGVWVSLVPVQVTTRVTGYTKTLPGGEVVESVALDMPPQELDTMAVAYTVDPLILQRLGISAADTPGTLHAAEHAAISLLPLIATCDRWDIGGVSTALHEDTAMPTVFVYDGYPGGAGFAQAGFSRFAQWIEATYTQVKECPCESGCPACIQSPKCGNGNHPLHKSGAIRLLGALAAMTADMAEGF